MLEPIIDFIVNTVSSLGYFGIFIMMVIESSFFPFPSEVAMIPAGFLSSTGEMNFSIALLAGTLGALTGAAINYFLGMCLGEKVVKGLIHKYGKYILLNEKHYRDSEQYFVKHGGITTLLGRFIPAVRQLISLPAGIFKMYFTRFLIFTGLGAFTWNLILMIIGYIAGENKELIAEYSKEAGIIIIISILVIAITYYMIQKKKYAK